ncbi:MAG TPA: hypothetical protein VNG12_21710 [Acidimicrobiales bacterium]|nr:hypothetical protein [Acidimicrobiales bacterium]
MPAAQQVTTKSNTMLGGSDADGQQDIIEALTGASSVREAAERVHLLDGMDEKLAEEARAVLDRLPKSVDQAILAALRSGVERGATTTVGWEEGEDIAVRVSESGEGDDHRVHVLVITPHGRHFRRP